MSPIVLSVTIVAYFAILFTISYIAGHKADNEGFFVGNHKSAWYIVAFAMIGSTISGVPRLSDTATAHFRALSPPFPAERHSHRIYCVALYIPGRCEITDMDRCTQNILSRCFCCPVHLLYSFEPAPEF